MKTTRNTASATDFDATATAEELAIARALDQCPVPPMPAGTVEAIHRRVLARRAVARARFWRVLWVSTAAAAAAVALLLGAWSARNADAPALVAEAADAEDAFAEVEAEWLSPYDEQFQELETTLLAFEALDFDSDATAFPSL